MQTQPFLQGRLISLRLRCADFQFGTMESVPVVETDRGTLLVKTKQPRDLAGVFTTWSLNAGLTRLRN